MFAIVGLGNPGTRYEGTRHNVGFEVIAELSRRWAVGQGWQSKFDCRFARCSFRQFEGLLVMPQKYMNLSGQACVPLLRYFKVSTERLIVAYDEVDLDTGQLRVKQGGSSAGHRGVSDIVTQLGDEGFYRVRLGISHPNRRKSTNEPSQGQVSVQGSPGLSDWVLGHPGPEEKELLEKSVLAAAGAIEVLLEQGLAEVQRQYHRKSTE